MSTLSFEEIKELNRIQIDEENAEIVRDWIQCMTYINNKARRDYDSVNAPVH